MVFHMYNPPCNATTVANDYDLVCYLGRSASFVEWSYLSTCTKVNARPRDTLSTCSSFWSLLDSLFNVLGGIIIHRELGDELCESNDGPYTR